MTNQEVNEYMQRFLDDDLNEDELGALMEHIRLSPASAILFDRLQRLDSELEQLPKVIPPMSIVDSILPRLELAGFVDHPPVTGTASTDDLSSRVAPMERRATLRERINYRLLGGVVAAGIVLTVFFMNFGPQMFSADEDSASSTDTMMVAESNATFEKKDAAIQSEPAGAEQVGNTERTIEADGTFSATFAEPALPESELNAPMSNHAVETPSPWIDQGKASKAEVSDASATKEPFRSEDAPEAPDMEAASESDDAASEELMANKVMVTTKQLLPSLISPNEQFTGTVTAVAEGGQQIIITDQSGNQVYQSAVYQGSLNQLTWSPDSTQLHFEAVVDNESTIHMTIHVTAQTESIKIAE